MTAAVVPPDIPAGAIPVTVYLQIGAQYVPCTGYFVMPPLTVTTIDSKATLDTPGSL